MNRTCCRKAAAFFFILSLFSMFPLAAEEPDAAPCLVETSVWMLANLMPDPPDFYQLSLGYRLDEKNIIFLNGLTWTYGAPLGIPFGPDFESTDEEYPGYVRAFGIGVGYQRFIWKGIFTTLYATPFLQNFYADDDRLLKSGFQLFLQMHLGYQLDFLKGRLYLKPALSFNYWPVNTNLPDSFQEREKDWPNYFMFEPHLNIGFRF